jgi:hypothetical protein
MRRSVGSRDIETSLIARLDLKGESAMFVACDEEYEVLIRDEFYCQVDEGSFQRLSKVDSIRAIRNEEIRYVGFADLQRLADQTMYYIAERRVPPPEYMLPVLALTGLVTSFH